SVPSGRPMGAALCSAPIERASTTSTRNYRAMLEPMNCCWNRIRTKLQPIGRPMDVFCCSVVWIRRRALTSGFCRSPAIKSRSLKTPFEERDGQFSPDGKWIAYQSNESGRFEIYVRPFPGPGGKIQISTSGGAQPRWNKNGKEIFYVSLDSKMMAAPVQL